VISAVKPSAMRMWMTIPMTVVDTIFKAMAQCVPERTIAAHHADLCSATFYGLNRAPGGSSRAVPACWAAASARSTTPTE